MKYYIRYTSWDTDMILTAEEDCLTSVTFCGQRYEEKHLKDMGIEKETPILKEAKEWLDRYLIQKRFLIILQDFDFPLFLV